ncbi:hypothetical protein AMS59_13070 [Lysinibacillus sp. FJAT-14745]|nr:hypothetical protein AMS59_13070 [Lysinibacillus sp. FJAT-14745]
MKECFLTGDQHRAAAATLALRFRAKNFCCCRFAFTQKHLLAQAAQRTPAGKSPAGTEINSTVW